MPFRPKSWACPPKGDSGFTFLQLSENEHVSTRSAVIATGVRYRRLGVENVNEFEGSSVHYWASVFAIGDVRAGSIKRVAAGVGEGAQVVAALHAFLASNRPGARAKDVAAKARK